MMKWQLLSELLNCSKKVVTVRSSCGAINDARLQCQEALELAVKLQAPSQYVHVQSCGLKDAPFSLLDFRKTNFAMYRTNSVMMMIYSRR